MYKISTTRVYYSKRNYDLCKKFKNKTIFDVFQKCYIVGFIA